MLAPWVVRNAVVFGRPLLATDSNTLIAGANCPDTYYGHDIGWWSLRCMERARTPAQVQRGDASTAAAWRYAGDHLGRLPLVAAVRVARTFDLYQPLRQGNLEPRRRWVDVAGARVLLSGAGARRAARCSAAGPRWELLAPVVMVVLVSAAGLGHRPLPGRRRRLAAGARRAGAGAGTPRPPRTAPMSSAAPPGLIAHDDDHRSSSHPRGDRGAGPVAAPSRAGSRPSRGIDLTIEPGEVFGFLGPNGAGKTTTVRMLCTLLPPTAGTATVAGADVLTEGATVRRRIGVALQEIGLDPVQTGRELLELQCGLYGITGPTAAGARRSCWSSSG